MESNKWDFKQVYTLFDTHTFFGEFLKSLTFFKLLKSDVKVQEKEKKWPLGWWENRWLHDTEGKGKKQEKGMVSNAFKITEDMATFWTSICPSSHILMITDLKGMKTHQPVKHHF